MWKQSINNQDVAIRPRVPKEDIYSLHKQLKNIDPACVPAVTLKEHLINVPQLVAYWDKYAAVTPYSFDIQKCDNPACYGVIYSPV